MFPITTPWRDATFIAIDLETTGKYPLDAEICEMAAVKWRGGQIVDTFQTLIQPIQRMSTEVIAIHNISNEMVANSPRLSEQLEGFHKFIADGFVVAHHAPFDLGFLTWEFENANLLLPSNSVFCTSLLSRAMNFNVPNHRLATLASHFSIEAGHAHRALDDAKTCLAVALKYFEKLGDEAKISDLIRIQGVDIKWSRFSIAELTERDAMRSLVRALKDKREVSLTYMGGSRPGQPRRVFPLGLVRSLDNDFLVATEGHRDDDDIKPKRYFLHQVSAVQIL